jgi:hypothetical protein
MDEQLMTLKAVAKRVQRPAHRIIHLCETGVVNPTVGANGRGTVRRFSREDAFRISLGLELQEMGIEVPLMKPLMTALDRFKGQYERTTPRWGGDLIDVVNVLSSTKKLMLAILTHRSAALLVPDSKMAHRFRLRLTIYSDLSELRWDTVAAVANLTRIAKSF